MRLAIDSLQDLGVSFIQRRTSNARLVKRKTGTTGENSFFSLLLVFFLPSFLLWLILSVGNEGASFQYQYVHCALLIKKRKEGTFLVILCFVFNFLPPFIIVFSLQELCVNTVMNCKQKIDISCLPEPLQELFPPHFKEIHKKWRGLYQHDFTLSSYYN